VTCVGDIMHAMSDLCSAANALCGEASQAGKHWVQRKLTEVLRGWVAYVIGRLRQLLTKRRLRQSVRETLANVITCFHNHRRWIRDDASLAAGVPVGTGVVEISHLYYPYTDNFLLSYDWRYGIIEPCRRGRQGSVSRRGRERDLMSTHVLPPRP
jgi:hypothetical protein